MVIICINKACCINEPQHKCLQLLMVLLEAWRCYFTNIDLPAVFSSCNRHRHLTLAHHGQLSLWLLHVYGHCYTRLQQAKDCCLECNKCSLINAYQHNEGTCSLHFWGRISCHTRKDSKWNSEKESGSGAAGKPMRRCILLSALDYLTTKVQGETLSSDIYKICSVQTHNLSYIYSQIWKGNGLIFCGNANII